MSDVKEVYSSDKHSFCDRCEGQIGRVFSESELKGTDRQVDNGLHVWAQGYYGGFWDTMSFAGDKPAEFTLCHDCCVWLANEIPAIAKEAKGGHGFHSSREERCCEFAGDWDDEDCPNRQREEIPEGWDGYRMKGKE